MLLVAFTFWLRRCSGVARHRSWLFVSAIKNFCAAFLLLSCWPFFTEQKKPKTLSINGVVIAGGCWTFWPRHQVWISEHDLPTRGSLNNFFQVASSDWHTASNYLSTKVFGSGLFPSHAARPEAPKQKKGDWQPLGHLNKETFVNIRGCTAAVVECCWEKAKKASRAEAFSQGL